MLKGAKGKIDFFSSVPALANLMAGQKRMYKNIDEAPALAKKLRSIVGLKGGAYHPVTLADSGIKNWSDIKDKTVFPGSSESYRFPKTHKAKGRCKSFSGDLVVE